MSKIGNYRIELQGTKDYEFGWKSAERGEPAPNWPDPKPSLDSQTAQLMGWQDYHDGECHL